MGRHEGWSDSIVTRDSFGSRRELTVGDETYHYHSIRAAEAAGLEGASRLPYTLKVLLENLLRWEDDRTVTADDIRAVAGWLDERASDREIAFRPARVLMQDFTGVPAVVDLAAMRDAMVAAGADPAKINPLVPVDLVIDHSVMVDAFGNPQAFAENVRLEFERNRERYEFLRWGQAAFDNFRVVPPGTGICHQVNLEYLGQVVWTSQRNGTRLAYPDTLVGTDSHTTMINGLAVLGWGVGGIEAEAAMLGQPISMLIPEVIGVRLTGKLREGATATDLVLTITEMLRRRGVVGKFVEFCGPGLDNLTLADQATIANMSPEYGATCGFFPIGRATIEYLRFSGRDAKRVALVEAYAKEQGLWRDASTDDPEFTDTLKLELSDVEPSLAGPKRPQDRVPLSSAATAFESYLSSERDIHGSDEVADMEGEGGGTVPAVNREANVEGTNFSLKDGDVVIAAITSCTNTSNPSVLIGAGLLARNARRQGLSVKPWVKTSFAPGSKVVSDYLEASGLQEDLNALGFNLVGYGCTTCIGNSGPLPEPVARAIERNDLLVASVLSGNRNFEGRIHPQTRANYLASPPLVVAYALAGSMNVDLFEDPLGTGEEGQPVYMRDVWPSNKDIQEMIDRVLSPKMFQERYADVFTGDDIWRNLPVAKGQTYAWQPSSTYVRHPTFFETDDFLGFTDVEGARPLAILGDSVTTDHISPAGAIKKDSPAGRYLLEHDVPVAEFNSYGSRRGNHEVMMRGTFANIRIRNEMAPGTEGGVTRRMPDGKQMPIYDAAMRYLEDGTPLVVIAGKEYGTGSSRDWAAKGTRLLGVKAVIAESYERIHRSNLIGMGVLPLEFTQGTDRKSLRLDGSETFDLRGLADAASPRARVTLTVHRADGSTEEAPLMSRIDTLDELEYYKAGGILQYVLKRLAEDE
jgi:aconitate hydratase